MAEQLEDLAWEILRDAASLVAEEHETEDSRVQLESVRLSCLNQVLSLWNRRRRKIQTPYSFHQLSYRSQMAGLTSSQVRAVRAEGFHDSTAERVSELNLDQFVLLLSSLHSLGSYRLPLDLDFGTLQRDLGAYYTPVPVADFIADSALSQHRLLDTDAFRSLVSTGRFRVLDPACGTGVFLLSAYKSLKLALEKSGESVKDGSALNKSLVGSLYGVDIDSAALEVAEVSLLLCSGLKANPSRNLRQGNSILSVMGLDGNQDYSGFFEAPELKMAFEWRLEFPEVFVDGGFDCVLMNPPYQRLKPNLAEFLRERLLTGRKRIHTDEFENHKRAIAEESRYYRSSGEYRFSNRFTLNTYQLFVERALQLARDGGVVGCIVPSSVLGDQSAQLLREELLSRNSIHSVYEFPENSSVFRGVTQSVSILTLTKGGETRSFDMSFELPGIESAETGPSVRLKREQITNALGPLAVIPRLSRVGWDILESIHRYPPLSRFDEAEVWRGELDLSINRSCMKTKDTGYSLVRGINVGRFNLRAGGSGHFVDVECLKAALGSSKRIGHMVQDRIATQQVSNMSQRWRLKCSYVESPRVLANSCNYISLAASKATKDDLWYLLGVLNSELLNWRFHVASFNNHVSIRELRALPLVQPSDPDEKRLYASIVNEARSLASDEQDTTTYLDACVFQLYGVNSGRIKHILDRRRTPPPEREAILSEFRGLC